MSGDSVFSALKIKQCTSKPREDLRSNFEKNPPTPKPNKLLNLPFKSYMTKERKGCMISVCLNPGMCIFISTAFDQ